MNVRELHAHLARLIANGRGDDVVNLHLVDGTDGTGPAGESQHHDWLLTKVEPADPEARFVLLFGEIEEPGR